MLTWAFAHAVAAHPALDFRALINPPAIFRNAMVLASFSAMPAKSVHVSEQTALAALGLALVTIGFVTRSYYRKRKQRLARPQEPVAAKVAAGRSKGNRAAEPTRTAVAE